MAGRPWIYGSQAERQAAYRARKAGKVIKLDEQTYEETLTTFKQLVENASLSWEMKTNLRALASAMASRDGYTWWKLERQRRG